MSHQEDPYYDPHWPCARDWLAGDFLARATRGLAVLGVPAAKGSLPPAQCDLAPQAVRNTGVIRHAGAGYPEAIQFAAEHHLKRPMGDQ